MSSPVTLRGRLTKDPELRFSNNGTAIASFTLVTAKRYKDDSGQWQEQDTSFWDCTAFKDLAENITENCQKGTPVIVTGQMRQEKWQTREGENRYSWRVQVDDAALSLKYGTREQNGQAKASLPAASKSYGTTGPASARAGGFSDDPPF